MLLPEQVDPAARQAGRLVGKVDVPPVSSNCFTLAAGAHCIYHRFEVVVGQGGVTHALQVAMHPQQRPESRRPDAGRSPQCSTMSLRKASRLAMVCDCVRRAATRLLHQTQVPPFARRRRGRRFAVATRHRPSALTCPVCRRRARRVVSIATAP